MEVSESNLIFHDIVIHNDGNQICMDLYSKGYGPFDFNNPKNCLKTYPLPSKKNTLREKCPNNESFLVCIFLYSE